MHFTGQSYLMFDCLLDIIRRLLEKFKNFSKVFLRRAKVLQNLCIVKGKAQLLKEKHSSLKLCLYVDIIIPLKFVPHFTIPTSFEQYYCAPLSSQFSIFMCHFVNYRHHTFSWLLFHFFSSLGMN